MSTDPTGPLIMSANNNGKTNRDASRTTVLPAFPAYGPVTARMAGSRRPMSGARRLLGGKCIVSEFHGMLMELIAVACVSSCCGIFRHPAYFHGAGFLHVRETLGRTMR